MSSASTGGHQVRTGGPARTQTPTSPAPGKTAKSILARLDRISVWSLPFMFIGIIGTGVGHLGGGIGVLVIAPQIPNMTVLEAMLVISGFLVLAAIVAQFNPNTRGRYYEEISP